MCVEIVAEHLSEVVSSSWSYRRIKSAMSMFLTKKENRPKYVKSSPSIVRSRQCKSAGSVCSSCLHQKYGSHWSKYKSEYGWSQFSRWSHNSKEIRLEAIPTYRKKSITCLSDSEISLPRWSSLYPVKHSLQTQLNKLVQLKKRNIYKKVRNLSESNEQARTCQFDSEVDCCVEVADQVRDFNSSTRFCSTTVRVSRSSLQLRIPFQFVKLMQNEHKQQPLAVATQSYGCRRCGVTNHILRQRLVVLKRENKGLF